MPEADKKTFENPDDFRQLLHDIGLKINGLVPETKFSAASIGAIDEAGVEHTLICTKPNNPNGFVYVVKQNYSAVEAKTWTWHRALQEDPTEQKVEEFRGGELSSERLGFDDNDLVEINNSITFLKNDQNGQA